MVKDGFLTRLLRFKNVWFYWMIFLYKICQSDLFAEEDEMLSAAVKLLDMSVLGSSEI